MIVPASVTIAVIAIAALALLCGVWWLWWRLPKRQIDSLAMKIRDLKARADIKDNLRKPVGQARGGAAVLIGAESALFQFLQQTDLCLAGRQGVIASAHPPVASQFAAPQSRL